MLYGLMAAYTFVFLSMNSTMYRLVKINSDPQRHSFDFEQILFQSLQRLLSYQYAKNADEWTDKWNDSFSAKHVHH